MKMTTRKKRKRLEDGQTTHAAINQTNVMGIRIHPASLAFTLGEIQGRVHPACEEARHQSWDLNLIQMYGHAQLLQQCFVEVLYQLKLLIHPE